MADEEQALAYLLWRAAQEHAHRAGFEFTEGSAEALQQLIRTGADRMRAEEVLGDAAQVERARAHVVRFTSAMIAEATERRYEALHEDTVAAAHISLCPIWPFC